MFLKPIKVLQIAGVYRVCLIYNLLTQHFYHKTIYISILNGFLISFGDISYYYRPTFCYENPKKKTIFRLYKLRYMNLEKWMSYLATHSLLEVFPCHVMLWPLTEFDIRLIFRVLMFRDPIFHEYFVIYSFECLPFRRKCW